MELTTNCHITSTGYLKRKKSLIQRRKRLNGNNSKLIYIGLKIQVKSNPKLVAFNSLVHSLFCNIARQIRNEDKARNRPSDYDKGEQYDTLVFMVIAIQTGL